MNLESVDTEISKHWHSVFSSRFLIIPKNDKLDESIKNKSNNGSIDLNDLIECIVSESLMSWENVKDELGNDYLYSKDNAVNALKQMPSLLQFVLSKTFKV